MQVFPFFYWTPTQILTVQLLLNSPTLLSHRIIPTKTQKIELEHCLWIVKFYNQKPKNKASKMWESNFLRVIYPVDIINLPKIEILWSKSIWLNFIKNSFFLIKVLPCSKTSKTKNFKKLITDSNFPAPITFGQIFLMS